MPWFLNGHAPAAPPPKKKDMFRIQKAVVAGTLTLNVVKVLREGQGKVLLVQFVIRVDDFGRHVGATLRPSSVVGLARGRVGGERSTRASFHKKP